MRPSFRKLLESVITLALASLLSCPSQGLIAGQKEEAAKAEASLFDLQIFRGAYVVNSNKLGRPQEPKKYKYEEDQIAYVDIRDTIPGQRGFSDDLALEHLRTDFDTYRPTWDAGRGRWRLPYDNGKSLLPKEKAVIGNITPIGIAIGDGNHHVAGSIRVGATTIPVRFASKTSEKSPVAIWQHLIDQDRVYFPGESATSVAASPPRWEDLVNIPNRYFASLVALKIKAKYKGSEIAIRSSNDNPLGIWIKVNKLIPGIECEIANRLADAGLNYRPEEWGKNPPRDFIEQARRVLLNRQDSSKYPRLEALIVLPDEVASRRAGEGKDRKKIAQLIADMLETLELSCKQLNDEILAKDIKRKQR